MSNERIEKLVLGSAKIIWKNFSGAQTDYNAAGLRNFHVVIDNSDDAEALANIGWNVKAYIPKNAEDDTDAIYHLKVSVRYGDNPRLNPKVYFVNGRGKKVLANENTIGMLDSVMLENVDLVIRPYVWEVNGKSGIKAYLDVGYFMIVEDPFAYKYDDGYSQDEDDDLPF